MNEINFDGLSVTEALIQVADKVGVHLDADAGFKITKPIERKLDGFARRLRAFGNHKGSTNIGADRYEIQVDRAGYTLLSVNGKQNPCIKD